MRKFSLAVALLALLALLLAGCSPSAPVQPSPAPIQATQSLVAPSPTSEPSPTPQPGKVILFSPAGLDAQPAQALLSELVGSSGLVVENRAEIQAADLTPGVKIVVLLAVPAGLSDLVAAAPQAQFIAVSPVDLPAMANLSVIRERADNQAFLAGFISALLSTDYRAAGLLPSDGPLGGSLQEAYTNGARYFCGVCAPGWPLGVYYPAVSALPSATDGPAWQQAAADAFDNLKVDVFFVSPDATRPEVIQYLQGLAQFERKVVLVGVQPPPEELRSQWAASVRFDDLSALRQLWPDAVAGKGGTVVDAGLQLEDVNSGLLEPGRLRLVNDLLEQLKTGKVYPLTVPLQ